MHVADMFVNSENAKAATWDALMALFGALSIVMSMPLMDITARIPMVVIAET